MIFDLGNVIVPIDMSRLYAAMAAAGKPFNGDLRARAIATGLFQKFEMGQITPEQFAADICREFGMQLSFEKFCEMWGCIFVPGELVPESLLERLRRSYRLLLLSNTNKLHYASQQKTVPMLRHFHDHILSYEVGAMKPDPKIYQAAIARAECRPEECFFTDDVPEYVEAARKQGMDAVQFQSAEQLMAELGKRDILVI